MPKLAINVSLVWAAFVAVPAFGGEYAVLSSGLRLHVDHHETTADGVRLYTTKDSFVEMPAEAVTSFDQDDYVPPPAPAPVPVAAVPPAPHPPRDSRTILHEAAARYALPPAFVESVAKVESALRPNAISPKGAVGVMQLMPGTARDLAADPNDPEQNIDAGTRLLRELLIKYNGDVVKALAAYNAGTGAVDRYQGLPPYPETQNYVDKVIENYKKAGGQ